MQPRKVRVADIERLKRTLENVPEHQAEEVTTAAGGPDAVLANPRHAGQGIRSARHRELLSDNGLAVTATTLKTYLSDARAAGGRKNRRKAKAQPSRRGRRPRRRVRRRD